MFSKFSGKQEAKTPQKAKKGKGKKGEGSPFSWNLLNQATGQMHSESKESRAKAGDVSEDESITTETSVELVSNSSKEPVSPVIEVVSPSKDS
jgi:hypothetical protein